MGTFTPSSFQAAIFDAMADPNGGSLRVNAVAGSGKTTTVVHGVSCLPSGLRVCFLAFNKSIAQELSARLPKGTDSKTFHALGFAAYRRLMGRTRVQVDGKKVWKVIDGKIGGGGLSPEDRYIYGAFVKRAVGLAKSAGLGAHVELTTDALARLCSHHDLYPDHADANMLRALSLTKDVLNKSNSVRDVIDFDDMLYLPVLYRARFTRYDVIIVDEAQDTNVLQGEILRRSLKRTGRLIMVGDPWQAIYGFRGADSSAMDVLAKSFRCRDLPLSVSYRCARTIVEAARELCPVIEPAPGAAEGSVYELASYTPDTFTPGSAILCRNTAPLISMAYALIGQGKGCQVLGRDIGQGLLSLVKKLRGSDVASTKTALRAWEAREMKALAQDGRSDDAKAQRIEDQAACLRTVLDHCSGGSLRDIEDQLSRLFAANETKGVLTLSTIHRSKGLEWDKVFVLDRSLMPSKWARQPWAIEQENNLTYVCYTRAKTELVFIRSGTWE